MSNLDEVMARLRAEEAERVARQRNLADPELRSIRNVLLEGGLPESHFGMQIFLGEDPQRLEIVDSLQRTDTGWRFYRRERGTIHEDLRVDTARAAALLMLVSDLPQDAFRAVQRVFGLPEDPVQTVGSRDRTIGAYASALRANGVPAEAYAIDGPRSGAWCVERDGSGWVVYHDAEGIREHRARTDDEAAAGAILVGELGFGRTLERLGALDG